MEDDEDFMLRPVLRGMCQYQSLKDGTLSLYDVCLMNEMLDIDAENQARVQQHLEKSNAR